MKLITFIKKELEGWENFEKIVFPLSILLILSISLYMKDNKIALISALCGVSYSILAGKGKISCYFFGLMGTFCYSFISFKNALYGNLVLYMCYYLPMQIYGIFAWKKNLKKDVQEIIKTKLSTNEKAIYLAIGIIFTIGAFFILKHFGDKSPLIDSITTVFSVLGLLFTVKRCIEQWYIWIVVNGLSSIMWIFAYINGSNCFATVLMWLTYFILSFYFLYNWKKEI